MNWLLLLVALTALAIYLIVVRPVLKNQPAFSKLFKAEASLWQKTQAKVTGWRTKIFARLVMIGGAFVGSYDFFLPMITGQDWTPITDDLPKWVPPVAILGIGAMVEYLRRITDNPPQVVVAPNPVTMEPQVVGLIEPTAPLPPLDPTAGA